MTLIRSDAEAGLVSENELPDTKGMEEESEVDEAEEVAQETLRERKMLNKEIETNPTRERAR